MQDSLGRLVIAPSETNGFLPSTQSVNVIMDSIKSFYLDAWISWGEIPVFDREQMWNHFRTKCAWYPQHDYQIFCNFEVNARYMLNDILESACENNQKPDWMLEGIWAKLNEKWTTAKFQKTSIQAKAPRASNKGDSLHIEGSAGEKKKGKTMTHDEVIEEKHVKNKKDGHKLWSSHMLRGQMLGIKEAWMNVVKVNLLLRLIAQSNRQMMMKVE